MKILMKICTAIPIAITMLSCAIDPEKELRFTAEYADGGAPGTRTVLQEDGTNIWWTPNEEINVFIGQDVSAHFVSTNSQPQRIVSFIGNVLLGYNEQEQSFPGYWAVYPYHPENLCDGESVTLSLPQMQTCHPEGFADKFFPSVARSSSFLLAFYNVCGGVRFSVQRAGIVKLVFRSNDGSPMAGRIRVGFGEDGKPEICEFQEPLDSVVVKAPEGGFVPGTHYFAAMLPQTHAAGISATLFTATQYASRMTETPVTVKRSTFGKLDNLDDGLENWKEYEPEKQVLRIPNSVWTGEGNDTKSAFQSRMTDNPVPSGTRIWINGKIYTIPDSREIAVPVASKYCLGYPADHVSWSDACVEAYFPTTIDDYSCAFYGYLEPVDQNPAEVQLRCLTGFFNITASGDFSRVRLTVDSGVPLCGLCSYGPMQSYSPGDAGYFTGSTSNAVVLNDTDGDREISVAINPYTVISRWKLEFYDQNDQLFSTKESSVIWTCKAGVIAMAKVNL